MIQIKETFLDSIEVKKKIINSEQLDALIQIGDEIVETLINGGKIMFCGNGGSAADAQHLAAELLIRLRPNKNRKSIAAISLAQDTSTLTACGNDYSFEKIYQKVIEGIGNPGDVLIGITTSGNSKNIINALKYSKSKKIKPFAFLGSSGGECIKYCEKFFLVPSENIARIQESHITAGHALLEYVEDKLFENGYIKLETKN